MSALLKVALDLTLTLSSEDRYERLVQSVSRIAPCDSCALLRYKRGVLHPIAGIGLEPWFMQTVFPPSEHPRLQQILESHGVVRFDPNDPRPDPFDRLVINAPRDGLKLHACMGAKLHVDDSVVGVITIDALKPGVFDHIEDQEFETFAVLAAATMHTAGLIEALERLAERRERVSQDLVNEALVRDGGGLIGSSMALQNLQHEIAIVSDSDLSVLLTGETGTGKDLIARMIHARSKRADHPLVYVNCAALPESVAESELFGHEKGAYTGALKDRIGKFELAHHGTLFLDEIGELPLTLQPKLLRALQSGEIQRVGSDKLHHSDARILAATNRDLDQEVKNGRFRADLYHRLSVYPIKVPPLRDHREDIPSLVDHFVTLACSKLGIRAIHVADDALYALLDYHWPGNVRELDHIIQRAILRATQGKRDSEAFIRARHLGLETVEILFEGESISPSRMSVESLSFSQLVDNYKRKLIHTSIQRSRGNLSKAARSLKLDRSNFHRLSKKYSRG